MTELRAFRVELSGPGDGVLARLGTFADLIGSKSVRVTVCVEEETLLDGTHEVFREDL